MNYKEALEEVKDQLINAGDYDVVYWDCIPIEILKTCAEALEKQIPRQVKKIRHETILGHIVTAHCPRCGDSVWQVKCKCESEYCFRCGQKLDWEVKE